MKTLPNYSVSEAKSKFSEILNIAKHNPVFISNRGKEIGVIISKEFYNHLIKQEQENSPKIRIQNFLKLSKNLAKKFPLTLDLPKRKSRKLPNFPT